MMITRKKFAENAAKALNNYDSDNQNHAFKLNYVLFNYAKMLFLQNKMLFKILFKATVEKSHYI